MKLADGKQFFQFCVLEITMTQTEKLKGKCRWILKVGPENIDGQYSWRHGVFIYFINKKNKKVLIK